MLIKIIY